VQAPACWAFSTTGALEGARAIATGKLIPLSEQQFVDCDTKSGDKGCKGGLMDWAFGYAKDNAICTERSYPYVAGPKGEPAGETCKASTCGVGIPKGGVVGFKDVAKSDMQAMMEAVMQQPVSVAIAASSLWFQFYSKGVWSRGCGKSVDHGVLVVGFGSENGKDYWNVKNSWGPFWGENGYFRLARGKAERGECLLLSEPSYPVVTNVSAPPSPPGPSPQPLKGEPLHYMWNKGKCVDLVDGNLTNGNKLQIWDCNGSPSQNWYYEIGGTHGMLKSGLDNSKCVDFGDIQEGTDIKIWDCNAEKQQDIFWNIFTKVYMHSCAVWERQWCMNLPNRNVTHGNLLTVSDCSDPAGGHGWIKKSSLELERPGQDLIV